MIFSKLFSPKTNWQNKDASVRVNSIENELSLSSDQDRQVMVQLAKQDTSDLVRRAALIKLNETEAWLSIGMKDSVSSIAKLAEKKLTEVMLDESILPLDKKLNLLVELPKQITEQVLAESQQPELLLALAKKIDKPHQKINLFAQKQIEELQRFIVENENDTATLEKLAKKTKLDAIKLLITDKLQKLKEAAEKPQKIAKDTQLVLSKLLALKDASIDYEVIVEKRKSFINEWHELESEFECLAQQKKEEFQHKYQTINDILNKVFIAKEEQYQQALIATQAEQQRQNAIASFDMFIEQKSVVLTNAIFENQALDEDSLNDEIARFELDVNQSPLNEKEKLSFLNKVNALKEKLVKADAIASSVTNATHLISKMAQQLPPVAQNELADKQQFFKQWLSDWQNNLKQAEGILPNSIINAHKEIKNNWFSALAPLEKEQQKLFNLCKRKASDVKRLLASGKYNAAFGVFNKFKKVHQDLLPELKQKLTRDYEHLSEKIAELSDWEHYIATPRKQQLLTEIQLLAKEPLDNPADQAEKVKSYRKTWNSLGHADEEIDKGLNEAFNLACEQAFAPCRQFYAEQDKIRETHLTARKSLIDQAKEMNVLLDGNEVNYKELEAAFNKLSQQWRNAGEVDRNVYKAINQEFQSLTKPVKNALNQYHDSNVELKKALIQKAEQLIDDEDVFKAVNEIKTLQVEWKQIGYAGVKRENALWREFRKANDVIFTKRSELNEQRQKAQDTILVTTLATLAEIEQSILSEQDSIQVLNQAIENANALLKSLAEEKTKNKEAFSKIENFITKTKTQVSKLKSAEHKNSWIALFEVAEMLTGDGVQLSSLIETKPYQQLSEAFTKKLTETLNANETADRHKATIELEIIAGIESPKADNELRMALQIDMMQQKMNSGQIETKEEKLWQWLGLGLLTKDDLPYIERAKKAIIG